MEKTMEKQDLQLTIVKKNHEKNEVDLLSFNEIDFEQVDLIIDLLFFNSKRITTKLKALLLENKKEILEKGEGFIVLHFNIINVIPNSSLNKTHLSLLCKQNKINEESIHIISSFYEVQESCLADLLNDSISIYLMKYLDVHQFNNSQ